MTAFYFNPLFGEADGYDGDGYDANGADRDGYDGDGNPVSAESRGLNLEYLWAAFDSSGKPAFLDSFGKQAFLDYLRTVVRDPDSISEVVFCISCGEPVWKDETSSAQGVSSDRVCESCRDRGWSRCDCCDDLYPDHSLYDTVEGTSVCEGCQANNYTYCEWCGGYYNNRNADDHYHEDEDGMCNCETLQEKFTIRNDGKEPLANGVPVTVTLPAGTISDVGIYAIRDYLVTYRMALPEQAERRKCNDLAYDLWALGSAVQTRDGNYPKRLSRLAFKTYQLKLPPEVLSHIGCLAADHSRGADVKIAVTRELNRDSSYFYHDRSCWWGEYGYSRCTLKTNGGFAMRSFSEYGVSGRAWVMPLRQLPGGSRLVPTFDTMTPDAFVLFNGYGDLEGYTGPRALAHMAGWTYRKIGFSCDDQMYINNVSGYLIAPEELAQKYTDGSLELRVEVHSLLWQSEQAEAARTEAATEVKTETVKETVRVHS